MPKHKLLYTSIRIAVISLLFTVTSASAVFADTTAPTTTYTQTPSVPNGNAGWYVTPVQYLLQATDLESGVKEINYRIDGDTWQKTTFSTPLNLAPNPSFEITGGAPTGISDWGATNPDAYATFSRDTGMYLTGYSSTSAKLTTTQGAWHAFNNQATFSATTPFSNMSASIWIKTDNVTESAFFKIYNVIQDGTGPVTYSLIGQSSAISGTNDWTKLSYNFIANNTNTIGVYMDIGLSGPGTIWIDAASITESITSAQTTAVISTDGTNHTLEYYSVDMAGNTEVYNCPLTNCVTIKIDQTPPYNWHDSGAFRGVSGAEHEVYVFTTVEDPTSGLSVNTNKYQYSVDTYPGYGRYAELLHCNTAWQANRWTDLLDYPLTNGQNMFTLITQKTDFCNSNWKVCKTAKFYAEDVAGNISSKDFCINGPWILFSGEGIVRTNAYIDMVAEPEDNNTDGMIEIGGIIKNFFTSAKQWLVKNSVKPKEYSYDYYSNLLDNKTNVTANLVPVSGVYYYNGNFVANNSTIPNNYDNEIFDQVVFINGDLTIERNLVTDDASTALFIVKGNVNIDKSVDNVYAAIFADGNISTAYNAVEGDVTKTLYLRGIYTAEVFNFQRTLQGTNNETNPSDSFTFEPKYLIRTRDLLGNQHISWTSIR